MVDFVSKARQRYADQTHDEVWEEIPVSYQEFFEKYIPEPFFPVQAEFAGAMLGEDPKNWSTQYVEGQAFWGKGSGKDRTAAKILVYVVYKLMCMRNPMQYLSAGSDDLPGVEDKIEIGNVCINQRLAKTVFFKYFTILLKSCKNPKTGKNWFVEHGLNLKRDIHTRDVTFPKNITAYSLDSKEYTGEGLNLFFVIFDEIGGFDAASAKQLYDALVSTCRSRFPQFMKILLLSYKRSDNDFMNVRFKQAESEPRVFRSLYATWDVNIKRKKEDFLEDYLRDPEWSERTYECTGETTEGGWFRYRPRVAQVFNGGGTNPVVGDKISVVDLRTMQMKETFKPLPQTAYYIHVDLAKGKKGGDACGFALGHFDRDMVVNYSDDYVEALAEELGVSTDKIREREGANKVGAVIDLALQIKAPQHGEIMFEEIRNFIYTLRKHYKFPVHWVTYDGWQSVDSIQQLRKSGVNSGEYSVDKTPEAYTTLKNVIYEGLFRCYPHQTAVRELEDLIIVDSGGKGSISKFKVDHPAVSMKRLDEDKSNVGSKDVADAIAGCVQLCLQHGQSAFKFWAGDMPGVTETSKQRPTPQKVQQYEAEELTKYGEKPPSWYRRHNNS